MELTERAVVATVVAAVVAALLAAALVALRRHRAVIAAGTWPGAVRTPLWRSGYTLVLAALCLGAAAAWPTAPPATSPVSPSAVLFLIDVSRSMSATDVAPSRLSVALGAVRALSGQLNGAMAVSAFAGDTAHLTPITTDHGAIALALDEIGARANNLTGGSTPATALDAVLDLASRSTQRAAIVVVSDGEWTDDTGLDEAILRSVGLSVPVYALAVGTTEGASMPVSPMLSSAPNGASSESETRITRVDTAALEYLAEKTRGQAWRLSSPAPPAALTVLLQTTPVPPRVPGLWLRRTLWLFAFVVLALAPGSPLAAVVFGTTGARRLAAVLVLGALWTTACGDRNRQFVQGNTAYDADDNGTAVERYAASVEEGRLADRAWFNTALALYRAGRTADALDAFGRAAAMADSDDVRALAHFNRGDILAEENQLAAAENAFVEALRAWPALEDARINLAIVRQRLNRPDPPDVPPPAPPRYAFPEPPDNRPPRPAKDW